MANDVKVNITVEEKAALQALTRLQGKFNKVEKDATGFGKKADKGITNLAGSFAKKLGPAVIAGAAAVAGFVTVMNKGIEAAKIQEDAVNSLNVSLRLTGQYTRETSEEMQKFASQLQQTSKFGDEVILQNAALIQSLGGLEKDGLKRATKAAIDMAAALKIDLRSAATLVGKAAAGEIGSFSRYGVVIKKGKDNAETFAKTLEALESKFGGAARGEINTYSGATSQLSNAWGDLFEELGKFVTKNETIVSAIRATTKGVAEFGSVLNTARVKIKDFFTNFKDAKESKDIELIDEKINDLKETIQKTSRVASGKTEGLVEWFSSLGRGQKDAAKQLKNYNMQLAELQERRKQLIKEDEASNAKVTPKVDAPAGEDPAVKKEQERAAKILEARQKLQADLYAMEAEAQLVQEEREMQLSELERQRTENEFIRLQEIEKQKLDIKLSAEEEKAKIIKDADMREMALAKVRMQRQTQFATLEKKQAVDLARFKQLQREKELAGYATALGQAAALTKRGSRENKLLATSNAIINTYLSATKAMTTYPFPANIAVMATTVATGLAQVAQIKKQSFATGGVVGGFSGASAGMDNVQVNARQGEMFLNAREQKNLFDVAVKGKGDNDMGAAIESLANQPIVVQIGTREIARAVRDAKLEGFAI